jgi:hypothetical protein
MAYSVSKITAALCRMGHCSTSGARKKASAGLLTGRVFKEKLKTNQALGKAQ